jgi:nucleotide-binding universal stress UspA family protein
VTNASAPILVPLDGSKNAEGALAFATRLASIYQAPILFVHVLHGEQTGEAGESGQAQTTFASYVEGVVKNRAAAPHGFEARVLSGAPAAELLKASEAARFVVIASHGRGGLRATMIGSVADKVVRGARVPTFLVPLSADELQPGEGPILVALDGSEEGEAGLPIARELGKALAAKVVLIRAYNMPPAVGVEFAPYPADFLTSLEKDAEDYLRHTAKPGEEALCVQSSAAEGIAQAAEDQDASLVVVASHGRGFAARLALGSTTDRLMHAVKRPMLIAPMKRPD